jgi:hypothetical protein
MEKRGTHIGYRWTSEKERNHQQDQDIGGWIMLKKILHIMGWYELDSFGSR